VSFKHMKESRSRRSLDKTSII